MVDTGFDMHCDALLKSQDEEITEELRSRMTAALKSMAIKKNRVLGPLSEKIIHSPETKEYGGEWLFIVGAKYVTEKAA